MKKLATGWPLFLQCLVMMAMLLACTSPRTPTQVKTEEAPLRLESGAVKAKDESGDWVPIAGESTFEIVGGLASTNPWKVTGNTFATRQSTQIEEGLEPGDLVRVKGIILEDGTWLANSIERVEEHTDPAIILIGKVTSVDPWVVNGITLDVTNDTIVKGEITAGMIVRVEILLLEDGIWEVLSIAPLGNFTEIPGCATITATVVSVDGKRLQLAGWPLITLGEEVKIENDAGGEGTLSPDQMVLVVLCPSEDGRIVITEIIILNPSEGERPDGGEWKKVLVCHKPDRKGGHTLSISSSAVPAHLAHGDQLGPCP